MSLDNNNYALNDDYKEIRLIINKIIVDMKAVTYDDIELTYTGSIFSHRVSGLPDGVDVEYVVVNKANPEQQNVQLINAGEYSVTASFSVDTDYYEVLSITEITSDVVINRALIDTNIVLFDNIECVYDGNEIELIISDTLPVGIKSVNYTNNKHTNCGSYDVEATFVIDENYAENLNGSVSAVSFNPGQYSLV